jgi:uncharacterized protein YndB with AHSA1/START domain
MSFPLNPLLDLHFERTVDLPKEKIWQAWTQPELLMQWFTPSPWKTIACEIDLRPGGIFSTLMQSPEGQEYPNLGCYLEIIPNHRLVWTNAFAPGFRPAKTDESMFAFTAIINLEDCPQGTHYSASVLHKNTDNCHRHSSMGFHEGWGAALSQLTALMKKIN